MSHTPEYTLSVAVARILDASGLLYTHVPNETPDPKRAAANKRMGTKAGVPDYLIFGWRDGRAVVPPLAIELKAPGGRTTETQRTWLVDLAGCGWRSAVCFSTAEVLKVLESTYGRGIYQ
ncbi:MAG: VRR-NUC domain-containing protein [Patescibacteria group bacterium]|jgi:hypothetical protein